MSGRSDRRRAQFAAAAGSPLGIRLPRAARGPGLKAGWGLGVLPSKRNRDRVGGI